MLLASVAGTAMDEILGIQYAPDSSLKHDKTLETSHEIVLLTRN